MLPGDILDFSYGYIIAKYQMRMNINKEKHFSEQAIDVLSLFYNFNTNHFLEANGCLY